jgi:hypothetical protein
MSNFGTFDTVTLPANFMLGQRDIENARRLTAEVNAIDQQRRRTPPPPTIQVRALVRMNTSGVRPIERGQILDVLEDFAQQLIAEGKAELT